MPIILRARKTVRDVQAKHMHGRSGAEKSDEKRRASRTIKKVWVPDVKFRVKRCGYVSMSSNKGSREIVSAPRSNDPLGKGSALMINRVPNGNGDLCYEINHPIVLVKNYLVDFRCVEFNRERLELSIERLLQYSGHDITIKEEIADLTILMLNMNGITDPFLLDIRTMLAKVLHHTVL